MSYTGACPERSRRNAAGRRTALGGTLAAVNLPASVPGGSATTYNADNAQTKFGGAALGGACPERCRRDASGNLTSGGSNTYTFDGRNHLDSRSPLAMRTSRTPLLGFAALRLA